MKINNVVKHQRICSLKRLDITNFFDQSCVISIIRAISFIGVFWQKINCSPFALLAHLLGGWGDEEAKQTGRIKSNSLPIIFVNYSNQVWASLKLLFCLLNWFNVMKPMVPLSQMILVKTINTMSEALIVLARIIWAKCFQLSTVNNHVVTSQFL